MADSRLPSDSGTSGPRLRRWTISGASAIADQSLGSGAGFLINLALARWMKPADYGAFAVAFSVFLLLAGIHNALLLEPASVFGPERRGSALAMYFRRQLGIHFLLTVAISLPLALTGFLLSGSDTIRSVGKALIGVAVALPLILLFWTVRRFQYIRLTPNRAVLVSGAYGVAAVASVALLHSIGRLSPASAFVAMGIGGLTASLATLRATAWPSGEGHEEPQPELRVLLRKQWSYGRWVLGSTLLSTVGVQLYSLVCAGILGLEAAGALRAMQILMLPMAQVVTAISTLILPMMVSDWSSGRFSSCRRKGTLLTLGLSLAACMYEIVLLVLHTTLERVLYGGRFQQWAWLIPILGLVPIATALSAGSTLLLKAAQKPVHYVVTGAVGTIVGLPLTVLLGLRFGLPGICLSLVITYATTFVALIVMRRLWVPRAMNERRHVIPQRVVAP